MNFKIYLRDDNKWSIQGSYYVYPFLTFHDEKEAQQTATLLNQTFVNGQEEIREEFRNMFRNIIGYEEKHNDPM